MSQSDTTEGELQQASPLVAPVQGDKKQVLIRKLHEVTTIRDDMVKLLSEKPFMPISQRQLLKKKIPMLDAQIKRLRLDINTISMLSNLSTENLENPKIVQHYQHYEPGKRKP